MLPFTPRILRPIEAVMGATEGRVGGTLPHCWAVALGCQTARTTSETHPAILGGVRAPSYGWVQKQSR